MLHQRGVRQSRDAWPPPRRFLPLYRDVLTERPRAASSMPAGAVSGVPLLKGGSGA
jgi:hypothetical protein